MKFCNVFNEEHKNPINHLCKDGDGTPLCKRKGNMSTGGEYKYEEGKWYSVDEGFISVHSYNHTIEIPAAVMEAQTCKLCYKKAIELTKPVP